MSLSSLTSRNNYVGNGAVSVYAFTFRILDQANLSVTKADTNGVETPLVLTTDYLVSGTIGSDSGGNITLVAGNLPTGYALTIRRKMPLTQPTAVRNQGTFYPETHETQFDRFEMQFQDVQDQLDRCFKTKETQYESGYWLPKAADRASKFLAFDGSGNPIAAAALVNTAPVSAYMVTFLALTTAQAALNNLSGTQVAGKYLRSDGVNTTLSSLAMADATGILIPANGGTGVASVTIAPTATAFAGWDANKNLSANNLIEGYATTATAAGTTTLVVGSAYQQNFTGSTTQTVVLPVTSTLMLGQQFLISNLSSGAVTVQSSGANVIQVMAPNTQILVTCILTSGTGIASWAWNYSPMATQPAKNFLCNSNFDFWQETITTTATNGLSVYGPDQWYCKNSLGTNGVLTISRVTGSSDGAPFGCKLQITTAPTAAQVNGCELYQTLDNPTSLGLYNQTASFSIKVKSFGNVNQIGIQFFYKTTEAKVDTAIGAEVVATVSTGSFTTISINGQALGTTQTASGVIGVRVRITGVSSGNTYDLNNGFVVEQGILNLGSVAAPYQKAYPHIAQELVYCQRFYEKSYDLTVAPGTSDQNGARFSFAISATDFYDRGTFSFKVTKRAAPTLTTYSTTGASGKVRDTTGAADRTGTPGNVGLNGCGSVSMAASTLNNAIQFHWVADARI